LSGGKARWPRSAWLTIFRYIVQINSTSAPTGRMASDARDSAIDLSQKAETVEREVDDFI
jgi:hypothetical protein